MRLIAIYPILYQSKQYKIGEEIPANDAEMVAAWIQAGTAKWIQNEPNASVAKAISVTAETGLPGNTINSETEENLAGKIPKTNARKKSK